MEYAKILSYGAIGLGFLLAVLSYWLLRGNPDKRGPIYIFMLFCLILVAIGAWLQYTADSNRTAAAEAQMDLQKMRASMKSIVSALQPLAKPLQDTSAHVSDGQVCSGGGHGIPLPNANLDVNRIATALQGIAAATEIAHQYAP